MLIGGFLERGRAEAELFFAFRPWLLLALAVVAMRWRWPARWALTLWALLIAGGSEAALVALLGASAPVAEALRGLAAGAGLALVLDLVAQGCARVSGAAGRIVAAIAGLALLALPGALLPYQAIALRGEAAAPSEKPGLMLLTGLPLVWGEGPIGQGEPSAAMTVLRRHFTVQPIDAATPAALAKQPLLLIAQPRPPGPEALVAIDTWVRGGGRALILTDPDLRWPSDYPLGDPRRPPRDDGLVPLLSHWGLRLAPESGRSLVTRGLAGGRRIMLAAPGRFVSSGACRIEESGLIADCRLGKGRALLLADADLLHDLLWRGPGPLGATRLGRQADNAVLVIDLLEQLAARQAPSDSIDWMRRPESFRIGLSVAVFVPFLNIFLGLAGARRRRGPPAEKDSDRLIHSPAEGDKNGTS